MPPLPTVKAFVRDKVPIVVVDVLKNVALPLDAIVRAVTAPLFPTFIKMLSVVPTPLVDLSVKEDDAVVPPIKSGTVIDVVSIAACGIVTVPSEAMVIAVIAPLLPTLKTMLSDVPTPVVD